MIKFSVPDITELEKEYVLDSLFNIPLSGDGKYTDKAYLLFEKLFGIRNILLTTSGTTALEMSALLLNLQIGDEVIAPSYTFTSTINAFLLRGAKPIFCDVRSDTMNIDESKIEALITSKTKAIYVVHYAGVCCEMDTIKEIAKKHNIIVVEDAAQAIGSTYKGDFAGSLSEIGCYSFHESKNYTMGEGGAIILNNEKYQGRAEILREKGTDRQQVMQGVKDKYTWQDVGSSYLPSDILAAVLCAQLERFSEIMDKRISIWNSYHNQLQAIEEIGSIARPFIPSECTHNAHIYYIIVESHQTRTKMIDYLRKKQIHAYFHYIPLHTAPMGKLLGFSEGMLPITEDYASRLLRLPLHTSMTTEDIESVVGAIKEFYTGNRK